MLNRLALFLQFLLICAVVYLKLRADSRYFLTPDSHYYLEAAQNLLDGKGYRIVFEGKDIFCAIWPIGYAALIAAIAWLTTLSVEISSKIVNLSALAGCFWLIQRHFKEKAWFVSLGLMSSSLVQLYTNTWSETVFIFFVVGFCLSVHNLRKDEKALWVIGAFLTRYAAVFLLIPLLIRRQYRVALYFLIFITGYLSFNFYQTGTFTGGHGFWPKEPFGLRLWRGLQGLEEEAVFFTVRDWDLKKEALSNSVKWFIYGIAVMQFLIGVLIIRHLLKWRELDASGMTTRITKSIFFLTGMSYLLFTGVIYLTDASIESLYFRRLAPSSLLITLGILAWVSQQKEIFERTKWLFVAFFVLSIIHSIPKMSSHHVVREKQEPALLIANGEGCSFELMGELLEWSPFVVVLDHAIHRVLDLGIKVDVLLGDFDHTIDVDEIVSRHYPLEIVHTPDQEKTDLEKGIEFLIERGFPAVNIVWATGRRADHSLTNMTNIVRYKDQIKIVMLDDYSKIFPLVGTFEKWYAQGTPISLLPVGLVEGIDTEGLKYNLQHDYLRLGYRSGNSNEAAADGFVKISAQTGDLLIMECWD